MLESIKKAVLKLFPELSAGLHLDRFARVLAITDPADGGGACERFRPRYAVDVQILDPDGNVDEAFPVYEAVPLPVAAGCGMEAGFWGYPEPGCLVVIGFAYGRPDHPVIRQVYPLGVSLPDIGRGHHRWQQAPGVYQDANPDGRWRRVTDGAIEDESLVRVVRAVESLAEIAREVRQVSENSSEHVGGVKLIEALGALKLLSGGLVNLSAVDNLNLTTARDRNLIVAQDRKEVAGGDHVSKVGGNRRQTVTGSSLAAIAGQRTVAVGSDDTLTVGGNAAETVSGTKQVSAAIINLVASTITIGAPNGGPSLLPLLSSFMSQVIEALDVLASHTHPDTGACSQGSSLTGASEAIEAVQTQFNSLDT